MKKLNFILCFYLFSIVNIRAQQSNPACPNGDAESNSFANWSTFLGLSTNPQNMSNFSQGFDANRTGVHSGSSFFTPVGPPIGHPPMLQGGVDYYGGFTIPNQGAYCYRIGNNTLQSSGSNGDADLMRYTFLVTNNNKHFKFRYALVLQDGGHSAGENPSVTMYMTLHNLLYPIPSPSPLWIQQLWLFNNTYKKVIADVNNPFFKQSTAPGATNVVYKDWQCVEYDLSHFVGQTVSLIFMARDCSLNGHFGYAYLDGLCTNWPATAVMNLNVKEFCDNGQSVIMNGAASTGEDRYFVEVAECDAAGNLTPNGDIVSDWFLGQQVPANFSVDQFYKNKGKQFKCGKYYKVKLAVMNDCAVWNETNEIIHFNCPPIDAGKNVTLCCGEGLANDNPITIGTPAISGLTYNWTSYSPGFTSTNAVETINPPLVSTAYILTVKDQNGCKATDSIIVRYQNSGISMDITKPYDGYYICDLQKHLHANINNTDCPKEDPYFIKNYPIITPNSVTWLFFNFATLSFSNINHGLDYTAPNQNGLVYAVVGNGCKNIIKTEPVSYLPQHNAQVLAPNAFTPNGDGLNDEFQIIEYGLNAPPIGQGPAYNAIDFKLTIYDRWGTTVLRTITKSDIGRAANEPLKNGDIKWDGKDSGGQLVANDVYNYTLEIQYCGNSSFTNVCFPGADYNPCIQWVWIFCVKHLQGCVSHVTVVR